MLQRDDILPGAPRIPADIMDDELSPREPNYANDDFDDVFGSAPPSPTSHDATDTQRQATGNLELSDIPRLREKHETEGYRDGVTKGKGESVQAGFDEGYGLGAVLGLRIGKILGLLEGILAGLRGAEMEVERKRVEALFEDAKRELATQSVFGREYWGEDGIWKFEVPGEGEGEVVFPDVARAHPLVAKWEGVVEGEVRRWGLDLGILDGEDGGVGDEEAGGKEREREKGLHTREKAKEEVASEPVAEGMARVLGISKKDLMW